MELTLSAYEVSVLMYSLKKAASDQAIGYVDADKTYNQLSSELNRMVTLPQEVVESALYYCNMLQEKKAFKHPGGLTFDELLFKISRRNGVKFNKDYNWLVKEW